MTKCRGYGKPKAICKQKTCLSCKPKTFASHPYVTRWSAKNTIQPYEINISAGTKCWFDCENCYHIYDARLFSIVKGDRCPYCAGKQRCDDGCDICFLKCFASHPKAEFWSDKNELTPFQIALNYTMPCLFDCPDCGHDYEKRPNDIVQRGDGCPYCAKHNNKLCDDAECDACFDRSFASHIRSENWSDHNVKTAREVAISCNDQYLFDCECGNVFKMAPNHIVLRDDWCPECGKTRNKGMERFTRLLLEMDPGAMVLPEHPQRIEGRLLRFDALITLSNDKIFLYESDARLAAFKTIYQLDRAKEKFVLYNGKIMFRASYRQFYDEETMRRLVADMIEMATEFDGSDMCGKVIRMDTPLYMEIFSEAFKARFNL
jgi:hypothetical protein